MPYVFKYSLTFSVLWCVAYVRDGRAAIWEILFDPKFHFLE